MENIIQLNIYPEHIYLWIFISTPFVILFFSVLGFLILAKRFFVRLLNIKDKKIINSDF